MINWADVRAKFPVTNKSVYLNTAAAGPLAESTAKAGALYYEQMKNDGDVHWDAWLARCEEVRRQVAEFINAEPEEIGFTTNTSSGMNLIVDALEKHGEVISCDLEFPVTTIPWMHRRVPVHFVKAVDGVVRPEDVRGAMNTRTGIISMSYVQFSDGFRASIEELASVKGNHALVINASQAAGIFEIDVKRMKIDALCTTGHKGMRSGYGSGFVYISKELQAAARQRTIGWLSVHDPYAMRNDEVHLRHDMSARAEIGCKVLSPLGDERFRSAETLVAAEEPAKIVADLASQKILVTEKPEGFRVATDFFNNEDDIDRLIHHLSV